MSDDTVDRIHFGHETFHSRLRAASQRDSSSKRFEVRASLGGGEETGQAWTDSAESLPRLVKAFEIWPAMKGVNVFDRLTGRYLQPDDVYREYGQPS